MQFMVYIAVAVVTAFSVALEWDALVEPSAAARHAVSAVSQLGKSPPSPNPIADADRSAARTAVPATPAPEVRPPVAAVSSPPPAANAGPVDDNAAGTANDAAATTAAPPPPAPQCDVNACAAAYVSFRASDCTWQPYEGPRRLCTKGLAADAAGDGAAANAGADDNAAPRCHYRTCAEHYSSFNPDDCSYQPLNGPRRRCEW
jgi:hypothetical protein